MRMVSRTQLHAEKLPSIIDIRVILQLHYQPGGKARNDGMAPKGHHLVCVSERNAECMYPEPLIVCAMLSEKSGTCRRFKARFGRQPGRPSAFLDLPVARTGLYFWEV
jgi:hypothetical protein